MSAANEILQEIYPDSESFDKAFVQFKKDVFDTVYKGSWSGYSLKHRLRQFAYAVVISADQQNDACKEVELHRMLQWFCQIQAQKIRVRIGKILARKETTEHASKLDAVYAGKYERYLSCIPELLELGYVRPEEEAFLDEYQADKGILAELENKIGATV